MTAAKALFASGCCRFSAFLYIESMQMTLSVSGRGLIALPAAMRIAEFDAAESELSQALELGQCFKK
jgi:hypothetical protein